MHRANVVFLPREVAVKGVCTDVQDLGIKRGEPFAITIERRQLLGSSRGPVERMKADHHIFLAAKIAEPDPDACFPFDGGKIEVRGRVSNFQSHTFSSQGILQFCWKSSCAGGAQLGNAGLSWLLPLWPLDCRPRLDGLYMAASLGRIAQRL